MLFTYDGDIHSHMALHLTFKATRSMRLHMNLHSESAKANAETEAREHILAKYLGQS